MKNYLMAAVALIALTSLTACSAAPVKDADYDRYATAMEAQANAYSAALAGLTAAAASCNGDARCVEHVTSVAALAVAGGGGRASTMQAPPRKMGGVEKFSMFMGAINPMANTAMNVYGGIEAGRSSERMASAQYGFLGGVVHDTAAAATSIATAGPRIDVGGDYVPGTQTVVGGDQVGGDQTIVGRDQIGRDQHIGDTVGGDQTGRDKNTNSHVGDNDRNTSPGPYTDSCVGNGCQPITLPDPTGD